MRKTRMTFKRALSMAVVAATECIVWGNTPSDGEDVPDPLFVDVVNGDLRLREGSPCIIDGVQAMGADLGAAVTGNVVSVRIFGHGFVSPMTAVVQTGGSVSVEARLDGRDFFGWHTVDTYGAVGDVLSTNRVYEIANVTNDIVVMAEFIQRDFRVDAASGDDANDGWEAPKRTIQSAIEAAFDGETIRVANGIYPPINSSNKAIRIESENGAEHTIFDGGGTNRCATLMPGAYPYRGTNTVIVGFTLCNGQGKMALQA